MAENISTNLINPDSPAKGITIMKTMPRVEDDSRPGRPGWWENAEGEARLQVLRNCYLMGCSDAEACFLAGIAKQNLYYYCRNINPAFGIEKENLKLNPIIISRISVIKEVAKNPAMAWQYLARKLPEEFGAPNALQQNIVNFGQVNQNLGKEYMELKEGESFDSLLEQENATDDNRKTE